MELIKQIDALDGLASPEIWYVLNLCRHELAKQAERVRELEAKIAALEAAIDAGGLDISPCLDCGTPVVTIPDGMTICDKCVEGANDQA